MNIAGITRNLVLDEEGIWVLRSKTSAVSYPEHGNDDLFALEGDSFWFHHRNRCILRAVRNFPPAGPLFDVGGGNGFVSEMLERNGIRTVLVEPGSAGIRNAQSRGLKTLVRSTLEDANFEPHSIPAVGLFDVLEHVENEAEFLKKICGLMKPGGRHYITVPAYQALWSDEDRYAGHCRRYTLDGLKQTLAKSGFTVEYATYFFWLLPLPIYLFRSLPSRLGFSSPPPSDQVGLNRKKYAPEGLGARLTAFCLDKELPVIEKRGALPFGGSCLVVARAGS